MTNNTQKIKEKIIKEFEEKFIPADETRVLYFIPEDTNEIKSFFFSVLDRYRQSTIKECIKAMPKEIKEKHQPDCHEYEIDRKLYECSCGNDVYVKAWNKYRTQALTKLKALKDDKLCFGCQTCKRSAN